jgi:hypothetical protein
VNLRVPLLALAGFLASAFGVCTVAAVVQFSRADVNAGFSDADHADVRAGRWWMPLSRDRLPPPAALLSENGKRLRRSGWRWAAAALVAFALLLVVAHVIQPAGV